MEIKQSGNKKLKCQSGVVKKQFVPQAHQLRVVREFLETNKRGLGFFHALGSGKTCAAYLAVDSYRKTKGKKIVYILSPASLASSHQHQYCNVCGEFPHEFNDNFKFYSYNDRQGIIKNLPKNMNNSIIIIDEVQEVLNGKENKSATLTHVYDTVLKADNVKIILLSGTPCYTPFQCSLFLNLLDPGITSFDEDTFMNDIRRENYLFNKCRGLISYVPIPNKELYPERVTPDIVDTFPMSQHQYSEYKTARQKELLQFSQDDAIQRALKKGEYGKAKMLKAMEFIRLTKLKSRQVCNFSYPIDISVEDEFEEEDEYPAKKSDKNASWILEDPTDIHVKNLKIYSPKMAKLIHRCLTLPGKHMVYGWFKSRYGLYLIEAYLRHCGVTPLLFSGDLGSDQRREALIAKFNSEDNIRGEKHKVILVSGAGAMGISLFGIRHFHNFESGLNEFVSIQAEGRAFRTMSHHQLPPDERNVQVYRYFTGLPLTEDGSIDTSIGEDQTTEQQMYVRGMKMLKKTEEVLDIMKRASFDCRESYNKAIKNCYDFDVIKKDNNQDDDYDFGGINIVYEEEVFEL